MLCLNVRDCVFHFNKYHLTDPSVPAWVLKFQGQTHYVNHVTAEIAWTTRETPDNSHTKGSIRFQKCQVQIDDQNHARIQPWDPNYVNPHYPLLVEIHTRWRDHLSQALTDMGAPPSEFRRILGGCGRDFSLTEITDISWMSLLTLRLGVIQGQPTGFRQLRVTDPHYQSWIHATQSEIWEPPDLDD